MANPATWELQALPSDIAEDLALTIDCRDDDEDRVALDDRLTVTYGHRDGYPAVLVQYGEIALYGQLSRREGR